MSTMNICFGREVRPVYGFADFKVPIAFLFYRNQDLSRNSKFQQETWIDSVQFTPSLLKASMNETKALPWISKLLLFVWLCSQRVKCIWQTETVVVGRVLEITHALELNKSEGMFSAEPPQVLLSSSILADVLLNLFLQIEMGRRVPLSE